ncbi:MAG: YggT family protein [Gammaproteobacteria bacterium]|nr:YggT family protein [Gammaproteobacteria bacterium]MDP2346913.1 YggT family protein [Gammaproteobacteria bacterium]
MGAIGNVGVLLVQTLGGLYLLAVLLRFLLQIARADFYNPFTQAIVKVTDPAVRIFRRIVPGYRGVDFASLVLAFLIQCIATILLITLSGYAIPGAGLIITWSAVGLLSFVLNIYFWGMIISIIASFIAPFSAHPALVLVRQLTEPLMGPFRRLLPSMGGLDLSPIFVFLTLQIIRTVLIMPMGVNPTVVLGI